MLINLGGQINSLPLTCLTGLCTIINLELIFHDDFAFLVRKILIKTRY